MMIHVFLRAKRASNLRSLTGMAMSMVIDLKHRPSDRPPSCLFVPFVVNKNLVTLVPWW